MEANILLALVHFYEKKKKKTPLNWEKMGQIKRMKADVNKCYNLNSSWMHRRYNHPHRGVRLVVRIILFIFANCVNSRSHKRWNRKLDGITPILPSSLFFFNLLAENTTAESSNNRFIWDNVRVVTWSSLLSGTNGSNNPSLCTKGTLNNVSRCVGRHAELRTRCPAGSPNLCPSPTHSCTLSWTLSLWVPGH